MANSVPQYREWRPAPELAGLVACTWAGRLSDDGTPFTDPDRLGVSERQLHRRSTAAAGYADQPHLTRECARLAGTTPARLVAVRSVQDAGGAPAVSLGA